MIYLTRQTDGLASSTINWQTNTDIDIIHNWYKHDRQIQAQIKKEIQKELLNTLRVKFIWLGRRTKLASTTLDWQAASLVCITRIASDKYRYWLYTNTSKNTITNTDTNTNKNYEKDTADLQPQNSRRQEMFTLLSLQAFFDTNTDSNNTQIIA